MSSRKWQDEVQKVPGYEVEWYVVYEVTDTSIEVLDYSNIDEETIEKLKGSVANIIHDLKTISDREMKSIPIDKRKLDVVTKAGNGYISMSLVADNMLVMAGLRKKA
jgi:hypothetical protein